MSTTQVGPVTETRLPARRRRLTRVVAWVLGSLAAVAGAGWLGLRIEPKPLSPVAAAPGEVVTQPLPDGLPAPVERFYRALYGDRVPVIDTAVISGRGTMRIAGLTFPARFRFSHIAGQDYRHYIELTVFGRRVTAVNEWFLDGAARLELPVGVSQGPNVDQGANLALWAEAVWMPSLWVTDPQVSWEPIDDTSARLLVPFGDRTETLTVTFDPDTGLLRHMESLRFKGEEDVDKSLWLNDVVEWAELGGYTVPLRTTVTWADEGRPWAELRTEDVVYNADLTSYIAEAGP